MKKLRRFKDVLNSDRELAESSIVGKGVAFAQNRIHAAAKTKYISSLYQIQNDCRQGIREDDARKRSDIQFQVLLLILIIISEFVQQMVCALAQMRQLKMH